MFKNNRKMIVMFVLTGAVFVSVKASAVNKNTLYSQLKIETGVFEKTKGSLEKCQADVLDLAWEGDDSNKVLRLGEKFIFAHLEQTFFIGPGLKSCNYKTMSAVSDKQVSQTMTDECPNKKDNQERTQTLKFEGDKLIYDFQIKNNKKLSFQCEYVRAKSQ